MPFNKGIAILCILLLTYHIIVICLWSTMAPKLKTDCSLILSSNSSIPHPFLVDNKNNVILPVLQQSDRIVSLSAGQKVTAACFGPGNLILVSGNKAAFDQTTCIKDSKLYLNTFDVELKYSELDCKSQNKDVLFEMGKCANGEGTIISDGWKAEGLTFIPLYEMCHDKKRALNYFSTNYIIGRSANTFEKGNKRPTFSQDNYYPGLKVDSLYTQKEQIKTITKIVGSADLAAAYVSNNNFLSRGHLAPNGDFLDWPSQDASFYFMNAAPQWTSFNSGNWNSLEVSVRNLAIERNIDLTVYTGTFGVSTLEDINGIQKPIYLTFDNKGNGLIPAPKYYWKLVYHAAQKLATAVVGINNPYNNVSKEDIFCENVCDQVPWLNITDVSMIDLRRGYTFCCTSDELHRFINFAPKLDVPLLK